MVLAVLFYPYLTDLTKMRTVIGARCVGRTTTMDVINFIITYFITKDLHVMTAFTCWPPDQISALWRSANEAGLRVTVYTDLYQPPTMMPYARHREAMVADMQCDGAAYLLQNASSVRAFNYRYVWLLLHNASYDRTIIEDTLEDYKILPDSDVVWSTPDSLIDVYRLKMHSPYLLMNLGLNWTSSKQELVALWGALPRTAARRKNLRNMSLNATSLITRPELFHDWEDTSTRQFDTFPKLTYWLMRLVEQDLNMHYNLHQVAFYGVWVTDHNGTYDGLMGLVQRGQAEVGFATMFMRFDRMDAVHFIAESYPLTVAIIYRQPSRSSVSNVFLAPFSSGVWMAIGLMTFSAALLLMLIKRIRETTHCQSRRLLASMTFPDTCTFALASMCQQGYHISPPVSSIRVVMFSTLLSALFLFTAYSAKIVALLQMPSEAIKTIEDLTKSPLTVGVHDSSYKTVYFKESKDPRTQALYRRKIVPHGERAYFGVNEGIALVKTGLFAFQVERSAGYDVITKTFTEREKCSLDQLEAFKLPMSAVPIKKYSGYREIFATRLRWLREVGLMTQLRHKWLVAWPRCDGVNGDFVSIGIKDVLPAIQVLGVGAALSVVILLAELMSHALNSRACECPRLPRRYSDAATARATKPWTLCTSKDLCNYNDWDSRRTWHLRT